MNTPRVNILVLTFAACGLAFGCARKEQVAEERFERLHTTWDETPVRIQQESVAVKQGAAPLAHIFNTTENIRVVDLTAKVQIAATTVGPQTLVRIDDRHGVIAGGKTITPGPLPAGHEYAIYIDPTTANVIRHGVGPPAQQTSPSSQQ